MAANLHSLTKDMFIMSRNSPAETKSFTLERATSNQSVLNDLSNELSGLMEKFADYLNDIDAVSEIDMRVSKVPFEILIFGKDSCHDDYLENED